jgi:signal transduction histidine kinase
VLLSELQHRTRNLLAVVQGIASQTARSTRSLEEFTSELSGRLETLARAQSLIEETNHGMIELRAIVEAELAARGDGANATASGEPVELPPKSIQVLALALHELGLPHGLFWACPDCCAIATLPSRWPLRTAIRRMLAQVLRRSRYVCWEGNHS